MAEYLPLYAPGARVTFDVTSPVTGGQLVEVGAADRSVAPAAAGSLKIVGVANHDAAIGDKLIVTVGKTIHQLKAVGAITRGTRVEAAAAGAARTLAAGAAFGIAINSAVDGAPVDVVQL